MTTQNHPHPRPFLAAKWIVLALVLFSFFMSALISRTVFERLPHLEDEVAYLFQARTLARGDLVISTPEPRRAFWQPFVVDYAPTGMRFGKYTIGWPLHLAVGESMGQAWVINAFFGAMTVALAYRLGREIFDEDTGLIAAALTAFSPAALLLNASLMGHTTALFAATLFIYAYWRIEKVSGRKRRFGKYPDWVRWSVIAGLALGLLILNRPLTGAAIAAPFVMRSVIRLIRVGIVDARRMWDTLKPLIALTMIALILAIPIPIYNQAATGNPSFNLYTLVWSYDRVGFGACCGRSGHTLEKGVRHMRFDMSLTAADLFGFAAGRITPAIQSHLQTEANFFPIVGLSFVFFPFALVVIFRWRALLVIVWAAALVAWFALPFAIGNGFLTRDPLFAWLFLVIAIGWVMLPILLWRDQTRSWGWLLVAVMLTLVGTQLAYWIGSQRYSTRYYYEALTAAAILSAVPLAWLARRIGREVVYGVLAVALTWSLYAYSTPRITALYRFNNIHHDLINAVEARRDGDRPVLVIVNGDSVRWRAFGTLMAVTSPYLDSEIVVAHNYLGATSDTVREQLLAMFPDRQVIELQAADNQAWFIDEMPPG